MTGDIGRILGNYKFREFLFLRNRPAIPHSQSTKKLTQTSKR
jgi:hypothetical protein